MIKEILQLVHEMKEEKKFKAQCLSTNFNEDFFEMICKKARIQGVEIELQFKNGNKAVIKPNSNTTNFNYIPFSEKERRYKLNASNK